MHRIPMSHVSLWENAKESERGRRRNKEGNQVIFRVRATACEKSSIYIKSLSAWYFILATMFNSYYFSCALEHNVLHS